MASKEESAKKLRRAADELARLADRAATGDAEREEFDQLLADVAGAGRGVFGPRVRARSGDGAKVRILAYLQKNVGHAVHGEELGFASGIQEWARRVRELRVEDGYDIVELGNSIYRLERAEPNKERAEQWRLAHELRSQPGPAVARIEAFLTANVGDVVSREQIDYVARIAEGSRRVRELRDEHGWPINSHIDEPDLQPGEYRLLSTDPADRRDASQRLYHEDVRRRVFERDGYRCRVCKRNREAALAAGDTRFYLEVHHTVAMADDLASLPVAKRHDLANLTTLCHSDHLRETAALHQRKREGRRQT